MMWGGVQIHCFAYGSSVVPTPFEKTGLYPLSGLLKNKLPIMYGFYIWILCSIYVCPYASTTQSQYYSFSVRFEIGKYESSKLCVCVCLSIVLAALSPLHSHVNFRISLFCKVVKKPTGIMLNLYIVLGEYCHLKILSFLIHESGMFFCLGLQFVSEMFSFSVYKSYTFFVAIIVK